MSELSANEFAGGGVTYKVVETPSGWMAKVDYLALKGWRIVTTNTNSQGIIVSVVMERAARYPQIETKEDTHGT